MSADGAARRPYLLKSPTVSEIVRESCSRSSSPPPHLHVAPITGLRVAREDVENDQRVRVKRTMTAFVRIARLISASNDRVRRRAAGAQHCGIDFGAENFRGQRFT